MTAEEQIQRIKLTVNEVFGYSSLDLNWIQDHDFDYAAFASENEWVCDVGSLAVTFRLDENRPVIAFGQNPGKKVLRKIAKEQKKQAEAQKLKEQAENV